MNIKNNNHSKETKETPIFQIHEKYQSIQEIIFTELRNAILNGELKPSEKLITADLAEKYGVSRTPVRESLTRLKSIGLVETLPHRGAYVKKLSSEEIMEIFYIRGVLSGLAARFALPKLSSKDISDLFVICDQMESFNATQSHKEMLDINSHFHNIIISATGAPKLIELLDQFYRISSQYRALGLELPGRYEEICKEHRLITESLMEKDADKAEYYSREHYFNTARRIAESIEDPISPTFGSSL